MLKAKHLPNDYWDEVVHCETYILNRFQTKEVMNRVPEEAWSGTKQGVTHMKVFSCVAYAHIPYQLRKKLDSKGEDRKSTRLNSSHLTASRMPSSA